MLEFDYGFKLQNKYFCSFAIAASVAGIASAAVGVGSALFGGGSGGGSGGGGSGGPAAYNPGSTTITSQAPAQLQNTKAATAYNPTEQMNQWANIFAGIPIHDATTEVPNVNVPKSDPTSPDTSTNGPS